MKIVRACLFLVVLTPVWAAGGDAPSMELLLYLAEWGSDAQGQAIDPIDLLDAAALEDGGEDGQAEDRGAVVPERSR